MLQEAKNYGYHRSTSIYLFVQLTITMGEEIAIFEFSD